MNLDKAKAAFRQAAGIAPKPSLPEDSPDDVSADLATIMAATQKLLAVNRGQAEPDERDSMEFRRIHTPAQLFAERIALDADRVFRNTMRRVARQRSLKPVGVAHFDPYVEGMIVGSPLSSPIEEINPLSLMEQARRITQMGPGGLPSEDSITEESQNVSSSQFGFISPTEGPESSRAGVDTRLAWQARYGSDGQIYQKLKNRRTGKHQWVSPSELVHATVGLPD